MIDSKRIKDLTAIAVEEGLFNKPNDSDIPGLEDLREKWKIFFRRFMMIQYTAIITPPLAPIKRIPESYYVAPINDKSWKFLCYFYMADKFELYAVDFDSVEIKRLYSEPESDLMCGGIPDWMTID